MRNAKAYKMIEERFSVHVRAFNSYPVSGADSDKHYQLVTSRLALVSTALERAPELKVTTPSRSLGDAYRTVRQNLTPGELEQYNDMLGELNRLDEKYGI